MAEELRVRLPSGREASLSDVFKFCYDLSDTDTQILIELIKGGVYSVEELAEKLRLSKATANRSLNKLVELGLVARRREKRQGVGRPRYKYYIDNPKSIIERIKLDLKECSSRYSEKLDELFSIIIKSKSK